MMKNYILVCSLMMLLFSCNESTEKEKRAILKTTDSSTLVNPEEERTTNPYQDGESQKALYKALKKKTPLTGIQLVPVLPEQIKSHKKIGEHRFEASNQIAQGMYGSFESPYNFWIEDGSGSRAIVRNFFDSFKLKNQGPEGTEYVYTEHDGYKTIAFLQPKIKRNTIKFIYNNRFRISIEGSDTADVLWSYIDFENLKKLDQYQ